MRKWLLLLALASAAANAGEATVAVAANFAAPARMLAEQFSKETSHRIMLSTGSTGKFFAQIRSGAPFDVLLSADQATPQRLAEERLAVQASRFTYALGRLVLWSPAPAAVDDQGEVLRAGRFQRLALANPKLAPYGAAARQVLENLGVWAEVQSRIVTGENIAQTFQFVATGNAELGFIAYSQILTGDKPTPGSQWLVPEALHAPIRQDAVLLSRAEANAAATQFLAFLRSQAARELIRAHGYGLP